MFKEINTNIYQSCLIEAGLPGKVAETATRIISDKISAFRKLARPFIWLIVPTLGTSYLGYMYYSKSLKNEISRFLEKTGVPADAIPGLIAMTQK
jgi:hypothetical protein